MLYIHIPYCKGKCIYCDFYSGGNPDWEKYLKAVASELSARIDELGGDCLTSIYLGGGTPSLIPADYFGRFMKKVWNLLERSHIDISKEIEVTIEVNPEDVDHRKAAQWKESGINRVSMGAQSFDDVELKLLRRRHSAQKIHDAFHILKQYFNNISLDLIYGIPGQSCETLERNLKSLIQLQPQHISVYALTYEPGTPLEIKRQKGQIKECLEDEYLAMERVINEKLSEGGYERYEISNYSKEGFRSRHNSGYWSGKPYLGLGPSACSYDGGNVRRTNPANLKLYLENPVGYSEERLTAAELAEEYIMLRLRTKEGIETKDYAEKFGVEELTRLEKASSRWLESGHLQSRGTRLMLTEEGITISDHIIMHLV